MGDDMTGIKSHGKSALFHILIKIEVKVFVFIISFKERSKDKIPFLQILAFLV